MDWLEALRARLLANGALTALLPNYTPQGGAAVKTVFWDDRPQGSPTTSLVLTVAADNRPQNLKGFDLPSARVQFDARAGTSMAARAIAEAALAAVIGPFVHGGHQFQRADVTLGPRGLVERLADKTVFRVSMDLIFHHAASEEVS